MALVSSSMALWDPCNVLNVYPNNRNSSCVGLNARGYRCGWDLVSNEHFSYSQLASAAQQLKSMAAKHPSDVTSAELHSLLRNTLCGWHQNQAPRVGSEWGAKIGDFVRVNGQTLRTSRAITQTPSEIAGEKDNLDRNEVKNACEALQKQMTEIIEKSNKIGEDQAETFRELARLNAKNRDELNAEVKRMRSQMENLESNAATSSREMQGLKDSKSRLISTVTTNTLEWVSLKAKVGDINQELDKRAKRSEVEVADLNRQLASSNREIAALQEALASLETKADFREKEAQSLREDLLNSNAQLKALEARSLESSTRLADRIDDLNLKYTACKDDHETQTSRLIVEQDQKIDHLVSQVHLARQEDFAELAKQVHATKQDAKDRASRLGQQLTTGLKALEEKQTARDQRFEDLQRDSAERHGLLDQRVETAGLESDRRLEQLVEQVGMLKREVMMGREREVRRIWSLSMMGEHMADIYMCETGTGKPIGCCCRPCPEEEGIFCQNHEAAAQGTCEEGGFEDDDAYTSSCSLYCAERGLILRMCERLHHSSTPDGRYNEQRGLVFSFYTTSWNPGLFTFARSLAH